MSAISSTVPRSIYDTADCKGLQEEAKLPIRTGKKPALKALAEALLGRGIQRGRHHDPCEDAYASLQLYLRYSRLRKQGRNLKERLHWPSTFQTGLVQTPKVTSLTGLSSTEKS